MSERIRGILSGLLLSAFVVGVIIVTQGFRRDWVGMSESGYWIEKAAVFGVVALVLVGLSAFQRFRGKSK